MTMKLEKSKLESILKGMGFTATTQDTYVMLYSDRRYLVDFKHDQVCRTDGPYFEKRVENDTSDEFLTSLHDIIAKAIGNGAEKEVESPSNENEKFADYSDEEDSNCTIGSDNNKVIDVPEQNMPVPVQNHMKAMQQMDEDLTQENVRKYICENATDQEIFSFLKLCEYRKLNPFIREAYLVKYGTSPATLIVGKDAFTKKAEENPMFDGFEAGVILKNGDANLIYREGQFVDKGEHLLGGWAKVYRKDRKIPFKSEVSMSEYNTGKSSWAKIPATMIRKVALVQALREAFPSDLGGCYDSAEMDQARRD